MEKMNEIILYVLFGLIGFVVAYLLLFKGYKNKVLEVLDTLYFTKTLDKEQYDYYKEKFVEKQDSLKRVRTVVSNLKKAKSDE